MINISISHYAMRAERLYFRTLTQHYNYHCIFTHAATTAHAADDKHARRLRDAHRRGITIDAAAAIIISYAFASADGTLHAIAALQQGILHARQPPCWPRPGLRDIYAYLYFPTPPMAASQRFPITPLFSMLRYLRASYNIMPPSARFSPQIAS